jgi:Family of unknown function (DUF5309)
MPGIAGLRGSGNFAVDERPKDYREMILFREPQGDSPIFALTSKAKTRVVKDPEFFWWDESMDIVRLQINAVGTTAGTTTLIVDSQDPDVNNPGISYGTATHLKAGDLLLVEPAIDTALYTQEIVEVVSVQSDTTFTVRRGAAGTTAAAIADNQFLMLIGSAYGEGTPEPSAVSRNPNKYSNFTQIFKEAYEIAKTTDAISNMRTGNAWSNDKKRKMFDHARGIEMSMLWGRKSEVIGPNGKPKRTMGGIRAQLPLSQVKVYTTPTTVFNLLDDIYDVFNFSSPAGDERIAMCGNQALNELNKIIAADTNSDIQWGGIVKVYGMNFREFVMPQGRILLKTHPLLSRNSIYTKSMWVLDFASMTYVTLAGRDTKTQDDIQTKGEDLRRGYVQTECSLELARGGLTCKYLGNISAT